MSNSNWPELLQKFDELVSDESLAKVQNEKLARRMADLAAILSAIESRDAASASFLIERWDGAAIRLRPSGPPLGATNPAARTVQNQPQTAMPAENAPLRGPLFDERARIRQKLHELASHAVD